MVDEIINGIRKQITDIASGQIKGVISQFFKLAYGPLSFSNNRAERAIRPVVVARKISGGSHSVWGANAWASVSCVMRTAEQQRRDFLETIKALLKAEWSGKDVALQTDTLENDSTGKWSCDGKQLRYAELNRNQI